MIESIKSSLVFLVEELNAYELIIEKNVYYIYFVKTSI